MIRFTVVEDFHSEETGSQYVAGLSYAAGPADERLHELIPRWLAEGKITLGGPQATVAGKD